MKKAVIAVALSVVLALLSANVNTVAHAQGDLVAPSNVAAHNTGNPGEVRISWDAVPNAAYYRIGWVAYSDVEPIIASGGDWLEHFAFIDIENRGQTQRTITRLTPGVQYAFIMASNDGRYGTPRWPPASGWAFLTLNEAPATHASLGSTVVDLSWGAVPGAEYYRVGWVVYEDVAPIIASGGDWLEHFAFIDIANRGQTQHTIGRLTPGLLYAFIVAGNDGRYGTPQWPAATAWQFLTPDAGRPSVQQPDPGQPQADQPPCPAPEWTVAPRPVATVRGDYDADDDGLIEVANLAQLDAIRYDRGGMGSPLDEDLASYYGAFPNAVAGMGCPEEGCTGYELVADLDFDTNGNGGADAGDTYWNDGAGWLPIDYDGSVFYGGGHTIANLFIHRGNNNYIGLFGLAYGDIRGIALASSNVTGGSNVGGLVGSGSVRDSCVAGAVTGSGDRVGGLVGSGGVSDSYATGAVTGSGDHVGGLLGYGSVSDSHATGEVTGSGDHVGGLVGSGSVSDSHATGAVTGSGDHVGGLVGTSSASVSGSYATGEVTGHVHVGGLVGTSSGSVSDSYSRGAVWGVGNVGGLVGSGSGSISDSYATGAVSGSSRVGGLVGSGYGSYLSGFFYVSDSYATGAVTGSGGRVGGLVGYGSVSVSDSYATGAVTGSGDHVGGLVGYGSGSVSVSYATGAVTGSGDHVGGLVGYGRGSVSVSDSYSRGAVWGRGNVGGLVGSASASKTDSVSVSDSYATGAVTGSGDHVGGLVGYGYGARYGYGSRSGYGSFSVSDSYATGAVTGSGDHVGGLVGYLDSDGRSGSAVSGSYATGTVIGSGSDVGGLVGYLYSSGSVLVSVSGSYATGAVTGSGDHVGGLVGYGRGYIRGSYAEGAVSGSFRVGGLVGQATGNTSYSYAVGKVAGTGVVGGLIGDNTGTVTDSYWDTVTSGQSHSDGGQGKTTSELQLPTGYTGIYADWNADLDNTDGDDNPMTGEDDPWDFGTSSQYPVLKYGSLNVADQRR